MKLKIGALLGLLAVVGCTSSEPPSDAAPRAAESETPKRENVFDPLVSTIGRAQGVQQTVDEQAEEQRRQIEAAER